MKTLNIICSCLLLTGSAASAVTHYVDINSTNPVAPYTNWVTAATTIQNAVDTTASGDVVLVADGVYEAGGAVTPGYTCMNRVVIMNNITVQSINGPAVTFIVGAEATGGGRGADAVRGVYMSDGVLSGFTITNGFTRTDGNLWKDQSGGGVYLESDNGVSGIVTNCVLTGNSAAYGGGSYGFGTLNNCTLTGNTASAGGGGGSREGTLNNCTLTGNVAGTGGGSSMSTLNNCTLTGNTAAQSGGGSLKGVLNNCTVSGNTADIRGGGCYDSRLHNCIVYFNTAGTSDDNCYLSIRSIDYTCTTPLPSSGTGNIAGDPLFIGSGDYHLAPNSPCINAGDNGYVSSANDLDDNPRIIGSTVDMGAYEYQIGLITNCSPVVSGFTLEWNQLPGCNSVVQYSTNLVTMPFIDLSAPMPYPMNSYTDMVYGAEDAGFSHRFYRALVYDIPIKDAITIENTDTVYGSGASSTTISGFDLNGGNALVVLISGEGSDSSPGYSVTYGGQPVTASVYNHEVAQGAAVFYWLNPTVSSGDVVVTFDGNTTYAVSAISLNNVDALGDSGSFSGPSTPRVLSYNGTAGGFVVASFVDNTWHGGTALSIAGDNIDTYLQRIAGTSSVSAGRAHAYGFIPSDGSFSETFTQGYLDSSRNAGAMAVFTLAPSGDAP